MVDNLLVLLSVSDGFQQGLADKRLLGIVRQSGFDAA